MTAAAPAPAESLRQLLADLHAERVATWRPEDLAVNVDQRRRLVETLRWPEAARGAQRAGQFISTASDRRHPRRSPGRG